MSEMPNKDYTTRYCLSLYLSLVVLTGCAHAPAASDRVTVLPASLAEESIAFTVPASTAARSAANPADEPVTTPTAIIEEYSVPEVATIDTADELNIDNHSVTEIANIEALDEQNFETNPPQEPSPANTETTEEEMALDVANTEMAVEMEDDVVSSLHHTGTSSTNIWDRIRGNFKLPGREHPRARADALWFSKNQEFLDRVMERAEPFLYHIVEEVNKRNMPGEIVLLPVVESAYQAFAYSPSRAAGIWQFIPGTARHYGLKLSWWYDGRRDIIASTEAALNYLEKLHQDFNGDWLLALAAYNSGEGTVANAIATNRRRGKATDFWSLPLPRETQGYVPRLLGIAEVTADPAQYGVSLKYIPDEPYLAAVDIGSQIDLSLVAKLADMDVNDIYRLNPGFNRWATDPSGPHHVLLPLDKQEKFLQQLADTGPRERVQWQRHKVKKGETLSQIAAKYGTTIPVLKQLNKLRGTLIGTGEYLIVPVSRPALTQHAQKQSQRNQVKLVHNVENGDTLWNIARNHGVPVRQLAEWNSLAMHDTLKTGQQLVVHKSVTAHAANRSVPALSPPHRGVEQKITYRVRSGDSLSSISRRFKVTVSQLINWNSLDKRNHLRPGQTLKLYVDITNLQESG